MIANRLTTLEEVAGIAFYGADDELMALSRVQRSDADYPCPSHHRQHAQRLGNREPCKREIRTRHPLGRLLLSVLTLLLTPPITVMVIQFSTRGNRSLPIVSVPSEPAQEQPAYLLTVKLHNQRSLNQQEQRQAIDDALTMGRRSAHCTLGLLSPCRSEGLALLISKAEASSLNALYALFASAIADRVRNPRGIPLHAINRD